MERKRKTDRQRERELLISSHIAGRFTCDTRHSKTRPTNHNIKKEEILVSNSSSIAFPLFHQQAVSQKHKRNCSPNQYAFKWAGSFQATQMLYDGSTSGESISYNIPRIQQSKSNMSINAVNFDGSITSRSSLQHSDGYNTHQKNKKMQGI
jgi:hypothetical protein